MDVAWIFSFHSVND